MTRHVERMGELRYNTKFWSINFNVKDYLEFLELGYRTILKQAFENCCWKRNVCQSGFACGSEIILILGKVCVFF
jgi:hypothetical protein